MSESATVRQSHISFGWCIPGHQLLLAAVAWPSIKALRMIRNRAQAHNLSTPSLLRHLPAEIFALIESHLIIQAQDPHSTVWPLQDICHCYIPPKISFNWEHVCFAWQTWCDTVSKGIDDAKQSKSIFNDFVASPSYAAALQQGKTANGWQHKCGFCNSKRYLALLSSLQSDLSHPSYIKYINSPQDDAPVGWVAETANFHEDSIRHLQEQLRVFLRDYKLEGICVTGNNPNSWNEDDHYELSLLVGAISWPVQDNIMFFRPSIFQESPRHLSVMNRFMSTFNFELGYHLKDVATLGKKGMVEWHTHTEGEDEREPKWMVINENIYRPRV